MVIDAHAHASGDFLDTQGIIRVLDANGVHKVVLVPGQADSRHTYPLLPLARFFPGRDLIKMTNVFIRLAVSLSRIDRHIPRGNCHVHSLADKLPDRVIQFYWVMLSRPNVLQEVPQRYREWHFKGLKLHQCFEHATVRSPVFEAVAEFAAENRLPIFIHARSTGEVKALIAFARSHPRACFIVAHLFGLETFIRSGTDCGNVYFEISSPPLVSLHRVLKALRHFGPQRIVLGSDIPFGYHCLRQNLDRVRALPIPEHERELILGGNMQELLRLP